MIANAIEARGSQIQTIVPKRDNSTKMVENEVILNDFSGDEHQPIGKR
jgi:hypothetical protein